jgi:hypothetical protein
MNRPTIEVQALNGDYVGDWRTSLVEKSRAA